MDLSPGAIPLALLLLTCGYLHDIATQPPNPSPTSPHTQDTVKALTKKPPIFRFIQGGLWLWHTALIVFPEERASICLDPKLLNQSIFSWSPYTIGYTVAVITAVTLRLLAYAQLGKNFTFQLAKPNRLVKTGLYRHVQHPSYTAILILISADVFYLLRTDGLAACILPAWIVQIKGLNEVGGCLIIAALLAIGRLRVRDEEQMLRQTFGKEWEDYHRKTKRFIPWVF